MGLSNAWNVATTSLATNYAMTAFGLGDMTYAKNLMQQVLEQGTSSSTALANSLDNPNIMAFAQAFNFSLYGSSATQTLAATTDVVNKYVMQTLETSTTLADF